MLAVIRHRQMTAAADRVYRGCPLPVKLADSNSNAILLADQAYLTRQTHIKVSRNTESILVQGTNWYSLGVLPACRRVRT